MISDINDLNSLIRDRIASSPEQIVSVMDDLATDPEVLDKAKRILESPLSANSMEALNNSAYILPLPANAPVPLDSDEFPISRPVLSGSDEYYKQGNAGTCLAWAMCNVIKSLGLEVNPEMLIVVMTYAFNGQSLHTFSVQRLSKSPDDISESEDLELINLETNNGLSFPDSVKFNARKIKSVVDKNGVILLGVNSGYLYKDLPLEESGRHAICINGYRINRANRMEVRVVDSNIGEVYIPIELLTLISASDQRVFFRNVS